MEIDEEWAAHLGAGLILCCFGRYEEALSSLFRCHQLALHSESESQGDRCRVDVAARALCEAVGEICRARGPRDAYKSMIPHFQWPPVEENLLLQSCSEPGSDGRRTYSPRAWSAFFVGWAWIETDYKNFFESWEIWLKRSLNLAARSPDNLCYIECSAHRLISKFQGPEEWRTQLRHLKMRTKAAARWGRLDEKVSALYNYGIVCLNNKQYDEAVRSREELGKLVGNSDDALLQSMFESLRAGICDRFERTEECLDSAMRVMSRLQVPGGASWSSYFGYCTTPRFDFEASPSSSPSRDEWIFWCLESALSVIVSAHRPDRESEIVIALAALAKYKQLRRSNMIFNNTYSGGMELWHMENLGEIYSSLFKLKGGSQWSDRAESVLARTLHLSLTSRAMDIYIVQLIAIIRLAEYMRTDEDSFYFEPGSDRLLHNEMIESFLGHAELLSRLFHWQHLSGVLSVRATFLFRAQSMDEVIKVLEPLGKTILEHGDRLGSSSRDRILYGERKSSNFEMLQAALISCQQPDRALMWAERERAQDLLHSVSKNQAHAFEEEQKEFNLDDAKALEEINSIAEDAGEDTAFLVYTTVWEVHGLCGFLLHQTVKHARFTKLVPALNISALIHRSIDSFHKNCTDLAGLQDLYKHLILPFEDILENINPKKLVIVPGKKLAGLPFAALYKGPGEPFLIQKYAISYIPSLRMYSHCKRRGEALLRSSKRESALVVGNPKTALADDLPYAEEEALRTKYFLEKAGFQDVKLLHQGHATRSALLESLTTSEWIHYAGHATVTTNFPHGALLVAPEASSEPPSGAASPASTGEECSVTECLPPRNEGEASRDSKGMRLMTYIQQRPSSEVVTGDDIQSCGAEVRALVTVLSACQSGLGEVFSEGVVGLYRALHVAGAPSVVCSLWDLDDEGSKSFMEKLYLRLVAGSELAIASQEVMVDLIDEDERVTNWAGFIISGNPEMKLRNVP